MQNQNSALKQRKDTKKNYGLDPTHKNHTIKKSTKSKYNHHNTYHTKILWPPRPSTTHSPIITTITKIKHKKKGTR